VARCRSPALFLTANRPQSARVAGDPYRRAKFLSEAAVTGELDHPNIVPIHDLGSNEEGQLFYAMKEVRGTSWNEMIHENGLQENLEVLMRVADAVAFAHSKGVIHRDLKPENVMLGEFGEVLVMDWGLAASIREGGKAESLRGKSITAGTPAYMPPEMARGEGDAIGPHSDQYLLGAILYEIITGRAPHTGSSALDCLRNAADNVIQDTAQNGELLAVARRAMATQPVGGAAAPDGRTGAKGGGGSPRRTGGRGLFHANQPGPEENRRAEFSSCGRTAGGLS
jgi:hypothetical protein